MHTNHHLPWTIVGRPENESFADCGYVMLCSIYIEKIKTLKDSFLPIQLACPYRPKIQRHQAVIVQLRRLGQDVGGICGGSYTGWGPRSSLRSLEIWISG